MGSKGLFILPLPVGYGEACGILGSQQELNPDLGSEIEI